MNYCNANGGSLIMTNNKMRQESSNYTNSNVDPRLSSAQSSRQADLLNFESREGDEEEVWLNSWLEKVKNNTGFRMIQKIRTRKSDISIHDAKMSLRYCLAVLDKLTRTQEVLKTNINTMSSVEWKEKTNDIGYLKDQFTQAMVKFENSKAVGQLRKNVRKRRKKREKNKMRKTLRKAQVEAELEERRRSDKLADMWLEQMKDKVERAKMEEHFKKDADCILSEVTKRKSEAKKQLSLVQSLIKLRQVREQASLAKGEKVSQEDSRAFAQVTRKLEEMWEDRLKMYSKEEQGLKLMLEETADKDSKAAKTAKENKIIYEWEHLLFGPKKPPNNSVYFALTAAERDLETFIAIRKSWDTFLVPHGNPDGTNIPIGWILPKPDVEGWNRYLKH